MNRNESEYAYHNRSDKKGITVDLGETYLLNNIDLNLATYTEFSYIIKVSEDQSNWELVVERTQTRHNSWQYHAINTRPVRFIRIMGTSVSGRNPQINVKTLEASYMKYKW